MGMCRVGAAFTTSTVARVSNCYMCRYTVQEAAAWAKYTCDQPLVFHDGNPPMVSIKEAYASPVFAAMLQTGYSG